MAKNLLKLFISLIVILLISIGCDKQHAKKLAGRYSCTVHGKYYLMGQYNTDTTYFEDLSITQEDKNIVILGQIIPVDLLWNENKYEEGSFQKYFHVQFKKDSVYISEGSSSQASNFSTVYSGLKKK
jgi:hypothetical protein|tara:strand:+ start:3535 stop:3915 length:381 start_codon:yes stop_codon:yes gene_type:complete